VHSKQQVACGKTAGTVRKTSISTNCHGLMDHGADIKGEREWGSAGV
jgi:hypothetical protein